MSLFEEMFEPTEIFEELATRLSLAADLLTPMFGGASAEQVFQVLVSLLATATSSLEDDDEYSKATSGTLYVAVSRCEDDPDSCEIQVGVEIALADL